MMPRSSSTRLGYKKPSVVMSPTFGWSGQRASSACRIRANVLLPTATLPATPMTYGTFELIVPKKVELTFCRFCVALTYRFSRRVSERYTVATSSRSMLSLMPRNSSRSACRRVSGVAARSIAHSSRLKER